MKRVSLQGWSLVIEVENYSLGIDIRRPSEWLYLITDCLPEHWCEGADQVRWWLEERGL